MLLVQCRRVPWKRSTLRQFLNRILQVRKCNVRKRNSTNGESVADPVTSDAQAQLWPPPVCSRQSARGHPKDLPILSHPGVRAGSVLTLLGILSTKPSARCRGWGWREAGRARAGQCSLGWVAGGGCGLSAHAGRLQEIPGRPTKVPFRAAMLLF